jgi:hypothetical protein
VGKVDCQIIGIAQCNQWPEPLNLGPVVLGSWDERGITPAFGPREIRYADDRAKDICDTSELALANARIELALEIDPELQ